MIVWETKNVMMSFEPKLEWATGSSASPQLNRHVLMKPNSIKLLQMSHVP